MEPRTVSALVFIAILLLILGIDQLRTLDRRMVARRVKKMAAKGSKSEFPESGSRGEHKEFWRKVLAGAGGLFIVSRLGRLMDKKLEEADVLLKGGEFVVIVVAAWLSATLFVSAITLNLNMGVFFGLVAAIIPFSILNIIRAKRLSDFNSQICDALSIIANSLRSGFSFLQGMDMVSKELPDPIKKEFTRTFREINFGTPTEDALLNMAERVNSSDLDLVVTAVLIQRQVGGNLSEVLDNISGTIRDRIHMKREIKTLTAQGKLSGLIVGTIPLFLGLIMFGMNRSYIMELFTNKIGLIMLSVGFIAEITGVMLIKKIVNIEF